MAKDINKQVFEDATMLKLDIFRQCFKEWLPVLLHSPFVERNYIYDFFSGSGKDANDNPGSPIILLQEAMGENQMHCSKSPEGHVIFAFNEKALKKSQLLEENLKEHTTACLKNCGRSMCVYETHVGNFDFKDALERPNINQILSNPKYGKFILLDQYGFKQVDKEVFQKLIKAPKTDFIFFISSSFIRRFKEHDYTKKYIETNKLGFDETKPKECHRVLANYFRELVPKNHEYYIHHFTIKKGSNYYGLIFGSGHTFGMEKFLKVCWEIDKVAGESNFNINHDFEPGSLFYTESDTVKIKDFKENLRKALLMGRVHSNIEGLKMALKNGVLPKVFVEVISDLKDKVQIIGKFNKKASNIHRLKDADIYQIRKLN
jgi:three-Cys-motif partner protein